MISQLSSEHWILENNSGSAPSLWHHYKKNPQAALRWQARVGCCGILLIVLVLLQKHHVRFKSSVALQFAVPARILPIGAKRIGRLADGEYSQVISTREKQRSACSQCMLHEDSKHRTE